MTIQAKNYQPDIMYGASLSVTNITAISDVASTTGNAIAFDATNITTGQTMNVSETGTTLSAGGGVLRVDMDANTVGQALTITGSGVYTGTGVVSITQSSATTGTIVLITANGLTTGHGINITSSGVIATTGDLLAVTGSGATTTTGLVRVTANALTSGVAQLITSSGTIVTTGALLSLVGNSATSSAGLLRVSGTGLTTGTGILVTGTAATLTTGRYISVNDSAQEVFGIGANGHIHSNTTALVVPPTIATNATGISACSITSGGSDTCGIFTTTGTPQSGTVLTITFGKTYTTAPKCVLLQPVNATAAAMTMPYTTTTATTAVLTWPAGVTYAATPSYCYLIIA